MLSPRQILTLGLFSVLLLSGGCVSPWFLKDKDETRTEMGERRMAIKEKLESEERPTLISEIGGPAMLTLSRLENIGIVSGLNNTGGEVRASPQRDKMLNRMRLQDTERPNAFLDAPSTTLIVATAVVPPAAQKGDQVDILLRGSNHATVTDLRNGWLMETPLVEMSLLGGEVREGFERASGLGYVVTRQQQTGDDQPAARLEGIVVGGAQMLKGRDLGIRIDSEFADAITMGAIVPAINKRFTHFDGREKTGVATPREAGYVEIAVPPRYRLDPFHFINVVLRTSFNETDRQRAERLDLLSKQLNDPTTVREACWQLEALGEQMIPQLVRAMEHSDPEISFYAAHSLGYLDDPRAVPKLVALCHQQAAFRAMCLNALAILESYTAEDALRELLHAANAEVKYGAVRALRQRDAGDPQVSGEQIGDVGRILEIPSAGPPLVAVSMSVTPEVVIFGKNPELTIPAFHYVNSDTIIAPAEDGQLTISCFRAHQEDRVVTCQPDLRSVLEGLAEVGGTYGDWVSFVRECHEGSYFIEPFALDPVPRAGRTYNRQGIRNDDREPGDAFYAEAFVEPTPIDSGATERLQGTSEGSWPQPDSPEVDESTGERSWLSPLGWMNSR